MKYLANQFLDDLKEADKTKLGFVKKASKLSPSVQKKSGKLFKRVSEDIGVVRDRWDKINKLGGRLTFGEEFSARDLTEIHEKLKDLDGILKSLRVGVERLDNFIYPKV